jgi:tetratricopeptide (TPR) repeat protein
LRLRKGDWDQAEAKLSKALDWAVGSENRWVEATTTQKLGEMYLAIGQEAQAERFLIRSLNLRRFSGSALGELSLLPYLSEVYRRTDRLKEAGSVLGRAHDIADNATESGALRADLWLAEGLVSTSLGQWEDAEAVFRKSIKMYQDYDLPWDEAKAYYEWAVALLGEGNGAPRAGLAKDLMNMALALWEPMGAVYYVEQCRRRLG